jgi:hypothetical protein
MFLQGYGENSSTSTASVTRYFEAGTGRSVFLLAVIQMNDARVPRDGLNAVRQCSSTVELQPTHPAAPTQRIWTATSSILLATSERSLWTGNFWATDRQTPRPRFGV